MKYITNFLFGFLIVILLSALPICAATYYVNATNGNDNNDGLSPSTAWKTMAKVNDSFFQPGDFVLFKRGEIWREQLIVPSSGLPNSPIIIGAYGVGNKPVITGPDIVIEWKGDDMNNVWYAVLPVSVAPDVLNSYLRPLVFFDGIKGTEVKSKIELDSEFQWYGQDKTLYIYSKKNPEIAYTNPGIEVPIRKDDIVIDNRDYENRTHKYITLQDIHIRHVRRWLVDGINSKHFTISNCMLEYASPGDANNDTGGILLNHNTTNATVENCIIHDIGSGVYIGTSGGTGKEYSSTGIIVRNNEIYNAHSGINIKALSVNNRVEGNYIHDITTQGIRAGGSENKGNVITRNFIENCAEDGIQLYNRALVTYNIIKSSYTGVIIISKTNPHAYDINVGDNNIIYNNVIHDNIEGILLHNFYGDIPENNVVKNNVISECSRAIRFSGGAPPGRHGNTFDYNCYYHCNILRFGNPDAITFEQWKAAYGGDSKSLISNPMFISSNPSKAADFYLQSNSKCVDAGTDVGLTRDFAGNPVPHGVGFDVGSYEYNGAHDSNPPAQPQNLRIRSILLDDETAAITLPM
jgi:hypothetical protein